MSKCVRWYRNSTNTTQLALSENGEWFSRSYVDGVYGPAWTKWRNMKKLERIIRDNGEMRFIFEYDFLTMDYISEHNSKSPNKFRLP